MIIGQLELIMLAHVLDWLPAMTIFTFGPSITYRTSANPFHTLGPSVTCRTSAIPFQTLSPSITYRTSANPFQTPSTSPTEFRPGHSNMLAQTIPKSWLTHYFQSRPTHYFNLGWRRLTCFLLAHPLLNSDWDIQYVGPDNT